MIVSMPLIALLCGFATAALFTIEGTLRRSGRSLLGRIERWHEDSTADATWYALGFRVRRTRWTHSTTFLD